MPSRDKDEFYALRRRPDRTYFSCRFRNDPNKRFAAMVWDGVDAPRFEWVRKGEDIEFDQPPEVIRIRHEAVIQTTPSGKHRYQVRARFLENSRDVDSVVIQRFTEATGKPHAKFLPVILGWEDIERLLDFFRAIRFAELPEDDRARYDDDILDDLLHSEAARLRFLRSNPKLAELLTSSGESLQDLDAAGLAELVLKSGLTEDVLRLIAESGLDGGEVVAVAHRREQLGVFRRLLDDTDYFEARRSEWQAGSKRLSDEKVWQHFLEQNTWILGYGLRYQFNVPLDSRKLEVPVTGHSVSGPGKRVDALLKTLGLINTLCYVEIKTHKTDLLRKGTYRSGAYPPTAELVGAVSQVQVTVQHALYNLREVFRPAGRDGFPTGEVLFNVAPKALVICGSLGEFARDGDISEDRVRSFELFRRSIHNPEIITFDELYERAHFIVEGIGDGPGVSPGSSDDPPSVTVQTPG